MGLRNTFLQTIRIADRLRESSFSPCAGLFIDAINPRNPSTASLDHPIAQGVAAIKADFDAKGLLKKVYGFRE